VKPIGDEELRFLDPWTLLLPLEGRPVIAVAGEGGKTALLHRLHRYYRERGASVLWTQTVEHPAPEGVPEARVDEPFPRLRERLSSEGSLFVAGAAAAAEGRGGLDAAGIEELRRRLAPDVVLVECQAPFDAAAKELSMPPVHWPEPVHLVFLVTGLHRVGHLKSGVVEEGDGAADDAPARVHTSDLIEILAGEGGLLRQVPSGVPVLPFLAGLAAYRDMDGMFEIVDRLWSAEGLKVVLMGELVGPARIDEAEKAAASALPQGAPHLAGERIYAMYPARLDEEGG